MDKGASSSSEWFVKGRRIKLEKLSIWDFKGAIAGFAAGLAGTILGHPLDTVKTRLQSRTEYKGMYDCFSKIVRTEGVASLYKGLASPLVSLTLLNMLSFQTYNWCLSMFDKFDMARGVTLLPDRHPGYHYVVSGAVAGFACSFLSTPFEMVKVQSQLDNLNQRRFKGSLQCALYLTKNYGVFSLFTGNAVNTIREIIFGSVYFGVYEHSKKLIRKLLHALNFGPNRSFMIEVITSGALSGMSGWFASFPLDVIKTNIQGNFGIVNPITKTLEPKQKIWSTTKTILKTKGFFGLYSGIKPSIIRAMFVSSCRFSVYELTMSLLNKWQKISSAQR
jgi:solute carrier family 25 carnitine/acylcarnitine transporter 20/29